MKPFLTLLALGLSLSFGAAHAADAPAADAKPKTAQQNKMGMCNKEAGDKKGDERKAFMKECLGAKAAAVSDKKTAQQEKMKSCNQDAGEKKLKGDERKAFMKDCLSK